ncbi:MAG: glycosyltransferase family 4 protein [Nitrospirae bacterium]|nr:glycosyltransferase family 4 protein [Nitrospirota bacterium]
MNILHTETLKRWGGQQNRVLAEAAGLNKRGHHVIIACHKGSILAAKAKQAGVKVYELNMVKQAYLKTIPQLMNIIKQENIDLVSTHSSVDSWAGGLAAKLTGRRLVRFRHNLYPVGRGILAKFIYSIPDRIITISKAVSDVLIQCGLKKERLTVIHSAVNERLFAPEIEDIKKELGIPHDTLIIGNTSTFTEVKGQEYLLQAFNIICNKFPCILLFAGSLEEPFKTQYLSHVDKELRDKVVFLGHRDDIPRILKTLDVFVFPSVLEGLGTALLEAMAAGRPVVVSDIPTFKDFIEDKMNGLYFKAGDAEDLAEKVVALLQDKELRNSLGRNARASVLERFTLEKMLDLTEARYREVLDAS